VENHVASARGFLEETTKQRIAKNNNGEEKNALEHNSINLCKSDKHLLLILGAQSEDDDLKNL
jgi:hypothetical protein